MNRIKIIGLCLVAVFAVSALAAASASATPAAEFIKCQKVATAHTGQYTEGACKTESPTTNGEYDAVSPEGGTYTGTLGATTFYVRNEANAVVDTVACVKGKDHGEINAESISEYGPEWAFAELELEECTLTPEVGAAKACENLASGLSAWRLAFLAGGSGEEKGVEFSNGAFEGSKKFTCGADKFQVVYGSAVGVVSGDMFTFAVNGSYKNIQKELNAPFANPEEMKVSVNEGSADDTGFATVAAQTFTGAEIRWANEIVTSPTGYPLTVTVAPLGSGTVECKVGAGAIEPICASEYPENTKVELIETPGLGYSFEAWSGVCTGAGTCEVTMSAPMSVTANFTPTIAPKQPLTITVTPTGSGTVKCKVDGGSAEPCASEYDENAEVEVIEHPGAGYKFKDWSEACTGTGTCVVTMTGPMSVTATNELTNEFPLTVYITGEGTVTSSSAGFTCPSAEECTGEAEGPTTLTAAPGPGYVLAGWIGCKPTGTKTCTVDVTEATGVVAVFIKEGEQGTTGPQGPPGNTGGAGTTGAQGPPGPKGSEGAVGREGPQGEKGAIGGQGPAGEKGANGANGAVGSQGPVGLAGPAGKEGPAGKVQVVTCKTVKSKTGKKQQKCTTKTVSGAVSFTTTGSVAQATLSRHGAVYAAGTARSTRGHMSLRLLPVRRLAPGRYTLTLVSGTGSHERIRSESFTLSAAKGRR